MTQLTRTLEFPKTLNQVYQKATRYEWISLFYMISATIFSFSLMFNSQTMKTVWLEDLLGIIPPLSFLISSRIIRWRSNANFPYGFHKITSMAFLSSSLALFFLGIFLFIDGFIVLISKDYPTIPTLFFFGYPIWTGYLMIIALLWSSLPSTILGHIKIPLAHSLYDKILYADSRMNKASWMSGFASIIGIIGIGFGLWWMDALVGILISLNIISDGTKNLKQAIGDLLDEVPKSLGSTEIEPIIKDVKTLVENEPWVKSAKVRFRDDGHVFFGDIFIIPMTTQIKVEKIEALQQKIIGLNWRLHDIIITLKTGEF